MWGRSIIDWLELIAVIQFLGFSGLIITVALLFRQHDQSVLSELRGFRRDVEGK